MNILFTCGGTAGHVNPAVAVARLFQQRHPGCQVLFVGADGGMECDLVPREGFDIRTVTITNFRRKLDPEGIRHNLTTLKNLALSRKQAGRILDDFRPDLVVGTGGYASYPVVREAARRGIPTAVHESNAVPGLTTQRLARVVDRVMVGFEESRAHYPHPERVVVTGTPVRDDFFRYTRRQAREKLGIDDERPVLLSYWGSLGASVMNGYTAEMLELEQKAGWPFRHIAGAGRGYEKVKADLERRVVELKGSGCELRQYIYDMPLVMAAADLVLCRAGASTLAEVSAIAKPSILVPSPNVTANHQEKNARVLSGAGGAVLMLEQDCSGQALYDAASRLLGDAAARDEMVRRLRGLGVADAGERIYTTLRALM